MCFTYQVKSGSANNQGKSNNECLKCPGDYCGRDIELLSNQSKCDLECGGCRRAYRTDGYFCQKCSQNLQLYDWLYLGFMSLTVTFLNLCANNADM